MSATAEEPTQQPTQDTGRKAGLDRRRLLHQGAYHLVAAVSAIALWAAADSWYLVSGLPAAAAVAVMASLVFGIGLAHLSHEWGHFLGARLSGAVSPVKDRPAYLMFDFDFDRNSPRQFLIMSIAGSLGNWLLVVLVLLAIPLDSPGRAMLLATTIAMGIYVAVLEVPAIRDAWRHGEPMAALVRRFGDPGVFSRSTGIAAISLIVIWGALLVSV